ncbi:hypothetical protein LY78DRAFT_81650 [Colletotrichum sublineola]|nr:hypothetical protein LY78DRAFT_81650 [Colletotrichum sublineola]
MIRSLGTSTIGERPEAPHDTVYFASSNISSPGIISQIWTSATVFFLEDTGRPSRANFSCSLSAVRDLIVVDAVVYAPLNLGSFVVSHCTVPALSVVLRASLASIGGPVDLDFTYHNTVLAPGTMDVDPARTVDAVFVSVDAGITVHIENTRSKTRDLVGFQNELRGLSVKCMFAGKTKDDWRGAMDTIYTCIMDCGC